jgi:hypothetical protein
MSNQPLKYYMHDGSSAFRFELSGDLSNEGARKLEHDWLTASSVIGHRTLIVDMTFLTGADEEGRALLARWHAGGARLVAKSKASRALAEAIVGEALPEVPTTVNAGWDQTWLPFRTSLGVPALHLIILLGALLLPVKVQAANLKPETVAAWDDYVRSTSISFESRVRPGGSFLWTDEAPERIAKVHNGEIVVAPAPGQNPQRVTGGLIHHWMGAAFLQGVKIDEVLEVIRDYDHFQDFYRPFVIDAKTIVRDTSCDKFSMVLMNKALFVKTALDADYLATNVRLDDRHFYTVSRTTRVQEIEGYGQPGGHRIPEGEGGGYIWKLFSIVRLEQRDGGVYLEMETVALSREIPAAARLLVDPVVRRVSRNSMLTAIQQTEEAVRWVSLEARKTAGSTGKTSAVARVQ